jgi:hypothetical protein
VDAQLERIFASKAFSEAGRMSALLRYLGSAALSAPAAGLKQHSIAIDVF